MLTCQLIEHSIVCDKNQVEPCNFVSAKMWQQRLLWVLISKYFADLTSVLILYDSSLFGANTEIYLNGIELCFVNLTGVGHPVSLGWMDLAAFNNRSDVNDLFLQHADNGIQGYITIHLELDDFLLPRLYATEKSEQRLKDRFYLFIMGKVNGKQTLSKESLNLYPHHLLVLESQHEPVLELWTQQFVGIEGNTNAVRLDRFFANESFEGDADLYPNKLVNLKGRMLNIATVTYIPYLSSYNVSDSSGDVDSLDPLRPKKSIVYKGTEAELILSFCHFRNCTIRAMPYGNDNWGGVYENGSSGGMIGSVYRHETEFGMGCYYNWYNELFETSITIAKSAAIILAPAPSRYPASMNFILPFNKLIWSLIVLSMFVSSVILYIIKYSAFGFERSTTDGFKKAVTYELSFFEVVAIFFQQSFSQSNLDSFAARFFLSTLLLAALTLENTYSGQLKSVLTIPVFTEPIDTIKKFAATDWKWASPSLVWILSIVFSDIPYEQVMSEKFVELNYEQLKNVSYQGNYGLGVERLNGGMYSFGDFIRDGNLDGMILVKDELYYDWSRAFAIRGWPLMDTFNEFVLRCLEHGLYNYWERKNVFLFMDKEVQDKILSLASGHLPKFPPANLTVGNISGPLYALAIGYSLAMVVLGVEIFLNRVSVPSV